MKFGFFVSLFFLFGGFGVFGQYYYFDTGAGSYPFQQGCSEQLAVRVNTESTSCAPVAGLLQLRLNPLTMQYATSDVATFLATNLFVASTETFAQWTNPSMTPGWVVGSNYSLLQLDRITPGMGYVGSQGLYGTLSFVPSFGASTAGATIVFIPDDTTQTTLSCGGVNQIRPLAQNSRLTGVYPVLQAPCVTDTWAPSITFSYPSNAASQQFSSMGISLDLRDNGGSVDDVPYVWTGGIWTGNQRNLDPSVGIDISSLNISLVGNSQSRNFVGSTYATSHERTWQNDPKNYTITIPGDQLFDFGVEKPITMTVSVRDRNARQISQTIVFNQPAPPQISARFPVPGASFVPMDSPVSFALSDDWAGVDTGSIRVTLSASGRGPYVVTGAMNIPHVLFPSSSLVTVRVQTQDKAANALDTSRSFTTRPSCEELGCCIDKYSTTKFGISPLLVPSVTVLGGSDPEFIWAPGDLTGVLDCGMTTNGLAIYAGTEDLSGGAQFVTFSDTSVLSLLANKVKVVLSGSTLLLTKLFEYGSLSTLSTTVGGGGATSLRVDSCPGGDDSPSYYDGTCAAPHGVAPDLAYLIANSPYSDELNEAYIYAYEIGMTKKSPIQNAELGMPVSRPVLSQMLVEYGVRSMGLYPDTKKIGCDSFQDFPGQSPELQFFMKTSCQMELMGMAADGITPKKLFDVKRTIDRGQFGTILSRILWGHQYNLSPKDKVPFYTYHLQSLKAHDIITNTNPALIEDNGYIMLMLKRVQDSGLLTQTRLSISAANGVRALKE